MKQHFIFESGRFKSGSLNTSERKQRSWSCVDVDRFVRDIAMGYRSNHNGLPATPRTINELFVLQVVHAEKTSKPALTRRFIKPGYSACSITFDCQVGPPGIWSGDASSRKARSTAMPRLVHNSICFSKEMPDCAANVVAASIKSFGKSICIIRFLGIPARAVEYVLFVRMCGDCCLKITSISRHDRRRANATCVHSKVQPRQ